MSSINPVLLFPAALQKRTQALAEGFVASLTLGAGQFCTNPGLVIALKSAALESFIAATAEWIKSSPAQTMLTPWIFNAYESAVNALAENARANVAAIGQIGSGPNQGQAQVFVSDAADFLADHNLQEKPLALRR